MLRDIPLRLVFAASFLFASLFPALLVSYLSYQMGFESLKTQAFKQLLSVRDIKKAQVKNFYNEQLSLLTVPSKTESEFFIKKDGLWWDRREPCLASHLASIQQFLNRYSMLAKGVTEVFIRKGVEKHCRIGQFVFMKMPSLTIVKSIPFNILRTIMNERAGMGQSGESYLVGQDYKMRSDSYLSPESHGLEQSLLGTVVENGANTEATRSALTGQEGTKILLDYNHHRVLSAYAPLPISADLNWAILVEIDEAELMDQITKEMRGRFHIILWISLFLALVITFLITALLQRNIRVLRKNFGRIIEQMLRFKEIGKRVWGEEEDKESLEGLWHDFRPLEEGLEQLRKTFLQALDENQKLTEDIANKQRLEAIGVFAGGIAHDFNNILACMENYLYLLDREEVKELRQKYLAELHQARERASGLVGQILTFSQKKQGKKSFIRLAIIVKEVCSFLESSFPSHIKVEKNIETMEAGIWADPTHLHQVVMNLCMNAYQAMEEMTEGVLRVSLKLENNHLCLRIEDTGPGIPSEIHKKIFNPFFSTKANGHGMGLAVVHGIVQKYQGDISFETQIGRGTSFIVAFPRAQEHEDIFCIGSHERQNLLEFTILLVDDDLSVLDSTALLLKKEGAIVLTCSSVEAGIGILKKEQIDLIISDYKMPHLTGEDFFEIVQRDYPEIPFLMISGYRDQVNNPQIPVLKKPFTKDELLSFIRP